MNINKDLFFIFTKKEIKIFIFIFFGTLTTAILDVVSFATIIPIFKIIFLNKDTNINFIKLNLVNSDLNLKILVLFFFIGIFSIKNILIIWFNFFFINFFQKINSRVSKDLFSLFINQEYIFFLKSSSENFFQKVSTDVQNLNIFLISFMNFFIEVIFIIGISILLIYSNPKIFLFCFVNFFLIFMFYYIFFKKKINRWSYNFRNSIGRTQNIVFEGLKGYKDIILYNLKNKFEYNFDYNLNIANSSMAKLNFLNNVQKYWLEIAGVVAMSLALLYFVFVSYHIGELVPIFALFTIVVFRLLSSLSRIILHGQSLKFFYPSFKVIIKEFKKFSEKQDKNDPNNKIAFNNIIEIKNVSFSYSDDENKILKNVNFNIKKGDCIGIVGKNGSGKSTLLNLISGLIQPSSGEIIVDNSHDLYSNRNQWVNKLSYVHQDIFLLDDSIKRNIVLVDDDKIDFLKFNKVVNLLKLDLHFKDFFKKLDTNVGNNGISLSGGQKQLISLARAFYKDSEVIILDEPTSALDLAKMKLIREVIISFKKIKTVIIVTHNKEYFLDTFDKLIDLNN
jgi:ABC-type multidrug transport system fused ATPase/permease subunit